MISLRKLFRNTFEGHKGRPGKRGGSLPEGEGSSKSSVSKPSKPSKPKKMVGDIYKGTFVAITKSGNILGTNFENEKKANSGAKRALREFNSNSPFTVMSVEDAIDGGYIEPNSNGLTVKRKR